MRPVRPGDSVGRACAPRHGQPGTSMSLPSCYLPPPSPQPQRPLHCSAAQLRGPSLGFVRVIPAAPLASFHRGAISGPWARRRLGSTCEPGPEAPCRTLEVVRLLCDCRLANARAQQIQRDRVRLSLKQRNLKRESRFEPECGPVLPGVRPLLS